MKFFFLQTTTNHSWPTADPHSWLLDHRDDPILTAARERLAASPEDPDRCLRVALRRCGLVLVHVVTSSRVVVQHWTEPAPDLRVWAKEHKFSRPGIEVAFSNLKTGNFVFHQDGHDLLVYGERVGDFPWQAYSTKYERRMAEEVGDDNAVAPASYSNFGWPGVPPGRLTFRLLKAVWLADEVLCPNCNVPSMLTTIHWNQGMLSFRSASLIRHCAGCRRRFVAQEDEPLAWVASVLPPSLRPTHLRQWRNFEINWHTLAFRHHRPADEEGGAE